MSKSTLLAATLSCAVALTAQRSNAQPRGPAAPAAPAPSAAPAGAPAPVAAPAPAPSGAPAPAAVPLSAEGRKLEEARNRYRAGLQLFKESNYEAARVEFERAYQLAPNYKVLYNIGLCWEQLNDYVQAHATFRSFLDLAGSELTPERRAEVEKELAQIAPRIADAKIDVNVDDVEVLVDDACAVSRQTGLSTCGTIGGRRREVLLNPGRHHITIKKVGYLTETRNVSAASADHVELRVDLKAVPKSAESNPFVVPTVIGWSVTAAGAITTIIAGKLASTAADDQTAAVGRFGVTRNELVDAKDKTNSLKTGTDIALIGTGVAAAISTYFTVRAFGWKHPEGETKVQVGLGSVSLQGNF